EAEGPQVARGVGRPPGLVHVVRARGAPRRREPRLVEREHLDEARGVEGLGADEVVRAALGDARDLPFVHGVSSGLNRAAEPRRTIPDRPLLSTPDHGAGGSTPTGGACKASIRQEPLAPSWAGVG